MSGKVLASACVLAVLTGCGAPRDAPGPASAAVAPQPPYVGQRVPGLVPEVFAPGLVSTGAIELNGVFSPDQREF